MVATIGALSNSAQAASYYEADDYYAEGGESPSSWEGKAAEELGLKGDVDRDVFRTLLDGNVDGRQLGTMRDGTREHRPGWDLTLSAPKSVSVMALVAGDKRLIDAHAASVKTALAHVERHMAATRIRTDGTAKRETTGNLAIASFRHITSRAQDPQLHTHNVILNITKAADGVWRSLEPRALYQLQKQIGAIYRQELAILARKLGYDIVPGKDSMFEIAGVPEAATTALSVRTAQIDARLEERGTSREKASAAEKQIAALDTRQAKVSTERGALVTAWRATADTAGFTEKQRIALVSDAEARATSVERQALADGQNPAALRAVAFAAEKLGERQSVFAESALHEEAGRFALGKVSYAAISKAIAGAGSDGELVARDFIDRRGATFPGFTTRTNFENEKTILRAEANGRGQVAPVASRLDAAKLVARAVATSERSGHAWTADQKSATTQLLSSRNRVAAVQGYAGTAKTTTVLATYAREASAHGIRVTALAPTAAAATVLGEALKMRGDTVARHLLSPEGRQKLGPSAWVVDEASLLSAQDMARLILAAEKADARVILVGDVKQLGSVGAGAAFAQLQSAGMETAKLAEIVRQTNPLTRDAVEASIEGDARRALNALDLGGGRIVAHAEGGERMAAMAKDYAALGPKDQRSTIVIEPSRAGRDILNAKIRTELVATGQLTGEAAIMRTLEPKGLTRAEARDARSYEIGDLVSFARDYADKGIARREAVIVTGIDSAKNAVALETPDGQSIDWRPRQWGAGNSETFTPGSIELMQGDRIAFTRNDRNFARENGTRADVVAVNAEDRTARIRLDNGKLQTLSLDSPADQHLRHGYVQTAHAAQGRTAERVMIHADSSATNLVDQKMLYVAVSRARSSAAVYTDDRDKLVTGIKERAGEKQVAIEIAPPALAVAKSASAGLG
ncbi:conjugative relaxase [Polymorphobacter multimanifer]|uniref:Conjugative relaxase-like TrwC/TraI family protein n=1 Tax=Polymorphobacter multimanifer TaxID=1070431 RepID=A0A841L6V7_9SPHN|nr:MobF family relaxase [Polymorphobacter multimanifer]MBB6228709.1 conjugative relaxase-like TrwC/TraI family protein [Polymorphobacter multimanifer]GGI87086.1 conjugative relaxase [Polymorphobacter multimanifer]